MNKRTDNKDEEKGCKLVDFRPHQIRVRMFALFLSVVIIIISSMSNVPVVKAASLTKEATSENERAYTFHSDSPKSVSSDQSLTEYDNNSENMDDSAEMLNAADIDVPVFETSAYFDVEEDVLSEADTDFVGSLTQGDISLLAEEVCAEENSVLFSEDGSAENYLFPILDAYPTFEERDNQRNTYLTENPDGTFTRTTALADDNYDLLVEQYSADYKLLSSNLINLHEEVKESDKDYLPYFVLQSFYLGETANWAVLGADDEQILESGDSVGNEVIRIVKYSKDWSELLGYKSIYNDATINTKIVNDFWGRCAMSECNGVLAIHTCHTMSEGDFDGHQANFTLLVREDDFAMDDAQALVHLNSGTSASGLYVSHSFEQFVTTDGENFYFADLGDGNPRAVQLAAFLGVDPDDAYQDFSKQNVLEMKGYYGENETGAEIADLNYLGGLLFTTGQSVHHEEESADIYGNERDLYLAYGDMEGNTLPGSDASMEFLWMTEDRAGCYARAYLVNISDTECYYLYPKSNDIEDRDYGKSSITVLQKITVGEDKTVTFGEKKEIVAPLSAQKPIYTSDGKLLWVADLENGTWFIRIDPEKAGMEGYYTGISLEEAGLKLVKQSEVFNDTWQYEFEGRFQDYVLSDLDYDASECLSLNDNQNEADRYVGKRRIYCRGNGVFHGELVFDYTIYPPAPSAYATNIGTNSADIYVTQDYTRMNDITYRIDVLEEGNVIYSCSGNKVGKPVKLKPDTVYQYVAVNYVMVGGEPLYGVCATGLFKTLVSLPEEIDPLDAPVVGLIYDDDGNILSTAKPQEGMEFFATADLEKEKHYYFYAERLTGNLKKNHLSDGFLTVSESENGINVQVYYEGEKLQEGTDYTVSCSKVYGTDYLVSAYGKGSYQGEISSCFQLKDTAYEMEQEMDSWEDEDKDYTEEYYRNLGVGKSLTKETADAAEELDPGKTIHQQVKNNEAFVYRFTPSENTVYMLKYTNSKEGVLNLSVYVEDERESMQRFRSGYRMCKARTLSFEEKGLEYAVFMALDRNTTYYLQGYNVRAKDVDITFSIEPVTVDEFQGPFYQNVSGEEYRSDYLEQPVVQYSFCYGNLDQGYFEGNRFTFYDKRRFSYYYSYRATLHYTLNGRDCESFCRLVGGQFETNAKQLQEEEEWTAGRIINVNARFGGQDFIWKFKIFDSTDFGTYEVFEAGKEYVIPGSERFLILKIEPEKVQSYKIKVTDPEGNDVNRPNACKFHYDLYDRFDTWIAWYGGPNSDFCTGEAYLNESIDFRMEQLTDERAKDGKAFYYLKITAMGAEDISSPGGTNAGRDFVKTDDWIVSISEQTDFEVEFLADADWKLGYGSPAYGSFIDGKYSVDLDYIRSLIKITASYSDASTQTVDVCDSYQNPSLDKQKRYAVISTNQAYQEWTPDTSASDRLLYVNYMGEQKAYSFPYAIETYMEWTSNENFRYAMSDIGQSSLWTDFDITVFDYTPQETGKYLYYGWRIPDSGSKNVYAAILRVDSIAGLSAKNYRDVLPYGDAGYGEFRDGAFYYSPEAVLDCINAELHYTNLSSQSENTIQLTGNMLKATISENGAIKPGDSIKVQISFDAQGLAAPLTAETEFMAGLTADTVIAPPVPTVATGTEVKPGMKLLLQTENTFAKIYYTTDGSKPDENSLCYEDGIVLTKDLLRDGRITIRAVAAVSDSVLTRKSDEIRLEYTLTGENKEESGNDSEDEDILPEKHPEGFWILGLEAKTYTGKAITFPDLKVYYGDERLYEKLDYTLKYRNNVKAGTASVVITGKGNYKGRHIENFEILPCDIRAARIENPEVWLTGKGKVQKPKNTITYERNGTTVKLKENKDYELIYVGLDKAESETYNAGAFKEPGTYQVIVRGKGNYACLANGEPLQTGYTVHITTQKVVTSLKYKIGKAAYQEGEKALPSTLKVKNGSKLLSGYFAADAATAKEALLNPDITGLYDYIYYTENDRKAGTAYITFLGTDRGEDGFTGQVTKSYTVTGTSIRRAKVEGMENVSVYTGKPILPGGADNAAADISADVNTTPQGFCIYLPETKTSPELTLVKGKDYTISYEKNVNAGTAVMVIQGINGYEGCLKKKFKITPCLVAEERIYVERINDVSYAAAEDAYLDTSVEESLPVLPYEQGGVKPKVTVRDSLTGRKLVEGRDYTVSYANNKVVTDITGNKLPTIILKGKGNYKGKAEKAYFIIVPREK